MVLADPGLVIIELIEVDQEVHVAVHRQDRILGQRVERGEKNAGLEESVVVHGWSWVRGEAWWMVAHAPAIGTAGTCMPVRRSWYALRSIAAGERVHVG